MMNYTIMNREEAKELTGWTIDMDQEYHGVIPGLLCGYNFEVTNREGRTDFCSATYHEATPEELMTGNHNYYAEFLDDMMLIPTGRVIFRGYYEDYYDYEEREECVRLVDMTEIFENYIKE